MPTPKPLNKYPPEFLALFERVLLEGDLTVIRCSSPRTAINYRMRLYAYRTALLRDPTAYPIVTRCVSQLSIIRYDEILHVKRKAPPAPESQANEHATFDRSLSPSAVS